MKKRLLFICASILALAATSPLRNDKTVVRAKELSVEERLFTRAEPLCRSGKIEDALEDLKRVLKLNPSHPGALYYIGIYRADKGDIKGATALLQRVLPDSQYGPPARERLAEISVNSKQKDLKNSIQSYLNGEAWKEALDTCKQALRHSPNNPELMYTTIYAAVMAGEKQYAEAIWQAINRTSLQDSEKGDLRDFIDAWYTRSSDPEEALRKLMGIKDKRIRTQAVNREIKRLLLEFKLNDEYERLLLSELEEPGVDKNAIERELIRFYIDNGRYDKAMQIISRRPIDSLEDNLLYIKLLSADGQYMKAMDIARRLIETSKDQSEPHEAFLEAYIKFATQKDGTTSISRDEKLKLENLVRSEISRFLISIKSTEEPPPTFTLMVLRASAALNDPKLVQSLVGYTMRLRFDESNIELLRTAAQELVDAGFRHESTMLLETALGQMPEDPLLAGLLAENYYLDGRTQEAISLLESILQSNPYDRRNLLLLVDCLVTVGKREEARNKLIEAMSWPDLPDLIRNQFKAKLNLIDIGEPLEENATSSTTSDSSNSHLENEASQAAELNNVTASASSYNGFEGISAP